MKLVTKSSSGFTLVELVVILMIMGFLSAAAGPYILNWRTELSLKGAANALYSHIINTKMQAVGANKTFAIIFDTANNKYFICDDWGADGSWVGAGDGTGTGDNNIISTYCIDGSDPDDANQSPNCAQRKDGVVLGSGDSTVGISGSLPASGVSYSNNLLRFNSQGVSTGGYVYLENMNATTSFAVGTRTTGLVRIYKSAEGESGYVQ